MWFDVVGIVAIGVFVLQALFWFAMSLVVLSKGDGSDRLLMWFGIVRGSIYLTFAAFCTFTFVGVGSDRVRLVLLVVIFVVGWVTQEQVAHRLNRDPTRLNRW